MGHELGRGGEPRIDDGEEAGAQERLDSRQRDCGGSAYPGGVEFRHDPFCAIEQLLVWV
jgi:hypothetical protein